MKEYGLEKIIFDKMTAVLKGPADNQQQMTFSCD